MKKKKIERKRPEHFYFLLLVMNSDTAPVAIPTCSRPGTPLQDERMEAQPDSTTAVPYVHPTTDEMKCEFIDDTFFTNEGVIIQFINGNCAGSTSVIGGMRLPVTDIKRVPAYLSRHKLTIKRNAIRYLDAHFQNMQCCIGATESLTERDYGMSFAVATLTHMGSNLNPGKRREGPLFFCLFTGLVEPTMITISDWDMNTNCDATHMINCYIHLLPPSQRRRKVIHKEAEDKRKTRNNVNGYAPPSAGKANKSKVVSTSGVQKYTPTPKPYTDARKLKQEIANLKNEVTQMKLISMANPPLPTTPAPRWPPINNDLQMPTE